MTAAPLSASPTRTLRVAASQAATAAERESSGGTSYGRALWPRNQRSSGVAERCGSIEERALSRSCSGAARRRGYALLMWRGCLLVGLVLVLGACSAASGRVASSGIAGRVLAGPTCPVQTIPPQPRCAPRPLSASLRIRRVASRAPATKVHSGADGRFRVRLSPGSYILQALPQPGAPFPRPPAALRVQVHARRFTNITITYDTGIR